MDLLLYLFTTPFLATISLITAIVYFVKKKPRRGLVSLGFMLAFVLWTAFLWHRASQWTWH